MAHHLLTVPLQLLCPVFSRMNLNISVMKIQLWKHSKTYHTINIFTTHHMIFVKCTNVFLCVVAAAGFHDAADDAAG